MNKDEVIEALESDTAAVRYAVAGRRPGDWDAGVYENGWNARQLLAHLAAIEWTYPKLIERARQAAAPSDGAGGSFDMDAYNQRQVAKRADASTEDLLDEFTRNRAATVDALRRADDDLLARPARSASGVEGTLLSVFASVSVDHVRQHLADLRGES